ncbi:MAG: hypothetical protein WC538_23450 [Thermoanaerobaculia bacterium]|jgi:hypothetical protein
MNVSRLALIAAAAALVAVTVAAAEPGTGDASRRVASPRTADADYEPLPLGVGLRVFIDPDTGRFRTPTRDELQAIAEKSAASKNKSIDGLVVEYRSDGSKHVNLQGRFMHSLRVTVNADGSRSFDCTDLDPDHPKLAAPAAQADR